MLIFSNLIKYGNHGINQSLGHPYQVLCFNVCNTLLICIHILSSLCDPTCMVLHKSFLNVHVHFTADCMYDLHMLIWPVSILTKFLYNLQIPSVLCYTRSYLVLHMLFMCTVLYLFFAKTNKNKIKKKDCRGGGEDENFTLELPRKPEQKWEQVSVKTWYLPPPKKRSA